MAYTSAGITKLVSRLHTELLARLTPAQQRQLRTLLARIDPTSQTGHPA
jgi:hypothetical protein